MDLATYASLDDVDRAVKRAALAQKGWLESLNVASLGNETPARSPLEGHRAVSGKKAFDALGERNVVSGEEVLRDALRRWVAVLTMARLTEEEVRAEARARAEPTAEVHLDVVSKTSFRGAWKGLVQARGLADGSAWLAAAAEAGPAVAAARHRRLEKEDEVARRLGFDGRRGLVVLAPKSRVEAAARAFLDQTRDLATALARQGERRGDGSASAVPVILEARAREANEGWPSRLSLRSLVETLHAPADVGRGLRVKAEVPPSIGASSFARGLMAFGAGYRHAAAAAGGMPFAVADDPWFVDVARYGFAFGALAATDAYQRRGLGLSARVAEDQSRQLARTGLIHARTVAVSALLVASADAARFEELTADLFLAPLPAALVGAWPRDHGDADARLVALLSTLPFLERLRDGFDDDWFRNPRAWQFLRVRASGLARQPEDLAELDGAPLARTFEKALG